MKLINKLCLPLIFFTLSPNIFGIVFYFNSATSLGVPPTSWVDSSQNIVSGDTPNYLSTSFQGAGVVQFTMPEAKTATATDGFDSVDRTRYKIKTSNAYKEGIYQWRIYIPDFEDNAQLSIGAFLNFSQSGASLGSGTNNREIDFEIFHGKSSDRSSVNGLQANNPICLMTVQQDDSSGTSFSKIFFEPTNASDHLQVNNWYTFTIKMTVDSSGRYVASWFIQKDGSTSVQGRNDFTCGYGPSNAFPTDFNIFCSLENLEFAGDIKPTADQSVNFDQVAFLNLETTLFEFESINDADVWSVFGGGTSNPVKSIFAEGANGTSRSLEFKHVQSAAFGGLHYKNSSESGGVDLPVTDWSLFNTISYWVKTTDVSTDNTVEIEIAELGGEIWKQSVPTTITNSFQKIEVNLFKGHFIVSDFRGQDGVALDLSQIEFINFVFRPDPIDNGLTSYRVDEIILADNALTPTLAVSVSTVDFNGPLVATSTDHRFSSDIISLDYNAPSNTWELRVYTSNTNDAVGLVNSNGSTIPLKIDLGADDDPEIDSAWAPVNGDESNLKFFNVFDDSTVNDSGNPVYTTVVSSANSDSNLNNNFQVSFAIDLAGATTTTYSSNVTFELFIE